MKIVTKILVILLFIFCATQSLRADSQSILPTGLDGKPLNLDFEDGTLKNWTAAGEAFQKQPVRGDLVAKRNGPEIGKAHV